MRRQSRNIFNEDQETKKMLYIAGGVLLIAILAFVITFFVYSNMLNQADGQQEDFGSGKITDLASTNTQTSQASTSIGKSVNQVQEQENTTNENTTKIAINTSNMQKEKTNTTVTNTQADRITNPTEQASTTKTDPVKDPTFVKPVEGEVTKEFAKDKLLYSNTLKEWVTHTGIDIKADKTTVVKAAAQGTIKSIKNDPRYGLTVILEHEDGYSTVYSNLLTAEFVTEGETVEKGQTIGTVGNTATFEVAEESHLHFEMLKDGENVDPAMYLQ